LRVLNVIGGLDPRAGGPPSSAQNIWIAARRAGVSVSAVFPIDRLQMEPEIKAIASLSKEAIQLHTFAFTKGPSKFKRWGVSLRLAAWVFREAGTYDVIHVHSAWMFSSLIGLIAARMNGAALVLMPHESLTHFDMISRGNPVKRFGKLIFRKLYFSFATLVIFSSQLEKNDSNHSQSKINSRVIFHPVFDDLTILQQPRSWPLGKMCNLRIGFLGRFHPKKNIELLIRAVADLPYVSLRLAGAGTEQYHRGLLNLVEQVGLRDKVQWLGFISAEQRPNFFSTIDVLVMPSAYECFGMVAAEAMVHGVPSIVSETTGIAELIAQYECGVIVPANVEAIRAAIERLHADSGALTELSQRSILASRQQLSFSSYGPRLAAAYRDIIQGRELRD
jgi:glycosyltransferase involved in cell wall biosynthesis